jgi:hypothetical protein
MTKHAKIGVGILVVGVYLALGIRGWLGVNVSDTPDPDGKYVASVYSHSPLLLPFAKVYEVTLPSQGDLNSHVVFRISGIRKSVKVSWNDRSNLIVICHHCDEYRLVTNRIDDIHIQLRKQ